MPNLPGKKTLAALALAVAAAAGVAIDRIVTVQAAAVTTVAAWEVIKAPPDWACPWRVEAVISTVVMLDDGTQLVTGERIPLTLDNGELCEDLVRDRDALQALAEAFLAERETAKPVEE